MSGAPDGGGGTTRVEPADDAFTSRDKRCRGCGHPVENLRRTCPSCGREYVGDDYDQDEPARELRAGTNVDDDGGEIVDEGPGAG